MSSFYQNKEQPNTILPLPTRLFQILVVEEGRPPLSFLKIEKTCHDFGKKCPDYDLPWITFSIQNVFLRIIFKQQRRILLLRHCCMLYFSPILVFVSSLL